MKSTQAAATIVIGGPPDARLALPDVTLCAVASTNVAATALALYASLNRVAFGACKFFTDAQVDLGHPEILLVPIAKIRSISDYSQFMLAELVAHIQTSHCLVVQWDGFVLNTTRWTSEFLTYDYVGASWPQFDDGNDVGNGGFSLRSRRLMNACLSPDFSRDGPEDVAICRTNRAWLDRQGLRIAPRALADQFSTERAGDIAASFGFHGAFNLPDAVGADAFWAIYGALDDRTSVWIDFLAIIGALKHPSWFRWRTIRMVLDRFVAVFTSK